MLIYGYIRIWQERDDDTDYLLLIATMLPLILGPIQQMVLYYVWSGLGMTQLKVYKNDTYILYELLPDSAAGIKFATPVLVQGNQILYPVRDENSQITGLMGDEERLPCGVANVTLWGVNVFRLIDYPACATNNLDLTVYCLDSEGQWNNEHISDVEPSADGEISFRVEQTGTCGLFLTR